MRITLAPGKPTASKSVRIPSGERALLDRLEQGPVAGFVAWHTLSNLYYLLRPSDEGPGVRDFRNSPVPALRPEGALAKLD